MANARISGLEDLPPSPALAVIINVHTELVSTLALASAITHAGMPVALVNCEPSPASTAHFDRLARRWDFAVLDAPVVGHHVALARVFRSVRSDLVLLLDSDAEIRAPELVPRLQAAFEHPRVFGSGFIHGPMWLDERSGVAPGTCLYEERPWMHCTMLRVAHVREAFAAGVDFAPRTVCNDLMWSRKISKVLAGRFQNSYVPAFRILERLPEATRARMRAARWPRLAWARRDFHGHRPNYVVCDTGADLYQWCKQRRELVYAGLPVALRSEREVVHYGGVTRMHLWGGSGGFSTHVDRIEHEVADRLARCYGVDWQECRDAVGLD
ncbi:MAG: hypothetical protein AMXMBFR46_14810 [Acidimicrobiia bacterium]